MLNDVPKRLLRSSESTEVRYSKIVINLEKDLVINILISIHFITVSQNLKL